MKQYKVNVVLDTTVQMGPEDPLKFRVPEDFIELSNKDNNKVTVLHVHRGITVLQVLTCLLFVMLAAIAQAVIHYLLPVRLALLEEHMVYLMKMNVSCVQLVEFAWRLAQLLLWDFAHRDMNVKKEVLPLYLMMGYAHLEVIVSKD